MFIEFRIYELMSVCHDCLDIVGPFRHDVSRPPFEVIHVQAGPCPRHRREAVTEEERWERLDFNRRMDLCFCCGMIPLRSGSKFNVWFCDACKSEVSSLNRRHRRCIIPVGRHSVHQGVVLRGDEVDDPVATHLFLDAWNAGVKVRDLLWEWRRIPVKGNLELIGSKPGDVVLVDEYQHEITSRMDPLERFREMWDYLLAHAKSAPSRAEG